MGEFNETVRDLNWLAEHGALAGVAEVIRERRRQIEQFGWTPEHDREHHANGYLMSWVELEARQANHGVEDGTHGPAECERQMAKAGALAAAEIDRLLAEFTPEPEIRTKTGRVLTEAEMVALAAEAERGYDFCLYCQVPIEEVGMDHPHWLARHAQPGLLSRAQCPGVQTGHKPVTGGQDGERDDG